MKTIAAFFIVLIFMGASADAATYYDGTAGFSSETAGAFCQIGYDVSRVLANSQLWQNGDTCGKVVTIYCNDPSYCTTTTNIQAVIVNVCDVCDSTFTFSHDDFYSVFPSNLVTGVNIEYEFDN